MPSPILKKGNVEATGSGGPASSAQAESASAGSVQAGSAQIIRDSGGVFSFRCAPDVEYTTGNTTTVDLRGASTVPRPMPDFDVNLDNVQYVNIKGIGVRPVIKLPKSNLEKVEPPPGMTYNQTFEWELAMLLEGIAACYEPLPTWDLESIYVSCSKYLGWATRHAPHDQIFYENWVGVEWMLP